MRILISGTIFMIFAGCNLVFQPANKPPQQGTVKSVKVRYKKGVQSEIPEIIPGQRIRVDTEAGLRFKMRYISIERDTLYGEVNKGTVPIAVTQITAIKDIPSKGSRAGMSVGIVGVVLALVGLIAFAVLVAQGF